ncbi:MAG: DUF2931 family protein, partial [Methylococcales bacterium]
MVDLYWKSGIASLLLILTGNSQAMSNNTKFDWRATESAPQHYPMEVIQGKFYFHGSNKGVSIPSGGTLSAGWGQGISNHHLGAGPQDLPDRLKIIYFSYAEKEFYMGDFELPYEKIIELFQDGVINPRVYPNGKSLPIYTKMMVGIAPGGEVSVWVSGQRIIEVFFGKAEKIKLDPGKAFDLPFKSQQAATDYINKQLINTLKPEELDSLKNHGIPFGLWSRYRKQFNYAPIASVGNSIQNLDAVFLNGEFYGEWDFSKKKEEAVNLPVPASVSFRSSDRTLYEIKFDEFEIMDAFEKLGSKGKKIFIEFDPHLPRTKIKIRVFNDEESIQ